MILANKLNNTCIHKQRLSADSYGDSLFADGQERRCRREDIRRLVLDHHGREVMSSAKFFLTEQVTPGDTLDGRVVLSVAALTGMFGNTEGFEVSCL